MDITNKTHFDTAQLRALFAVCMRAEGVEPRGYRVDVVYSRRGCVTGFGWYHRRQLRLCLPKAGQGPDGMVDGAEFAQVLAHEIGHNRGLRHKDMLPCRSLSVPYAEGVRIMRQAPKPAVVTDLVAKRAAHVDAQLAKWEDKLRRAKQRVSHWQKKQRYYARTLAEREVKRAALSPSASRGA